jgi:hypothetical protein
MSEKYVVYCYETPNSDHPARYLSGAKEQIDDVISQIKDKTAYPGMQGKKLLVMRESVEHYLTVEP